MSQWLMSLQNVLSQLCMSDKDTDWEKDSDWKREQRQCINTRRLGSILTPLDSIKEGDRGQRPLCLLDHNVDRECCQISL